MGTQQLKEKCLPMGFPSEGCIYLVLPVNLICARRWKTTLNPQLKVCCVEPSWHSLSSFIHYLLRIVLVSTGWVWTQCFYCYSSVWVAPLWCFHKLLLRICTPSVCNNEAFSKLQIATLMMESVAESQLNELRSRPHWGLEENSRWDDLDNPLRGICSW